MSGHKATVSNPVRLPLEWLQGIQIHTTLTPMISPLACLTFFNCLEQRLDNSRMRFNAILPEEVPEPGLGYHFIGREYAHAIDFGVWV